MRDLKTFQENEVEKTFCYQYQITTLIEIKNLLKLICICSFFFYLSICRKR
jgi:hypothetical protein